MTGFEPRPSGLEMTALPTEPQPQIFTQTHELCQCLKVFYIFCWLDHRKMSFYLVPLMPWMNHVGNIHLVVLLCATDLQFLGSMRGVSTDHLLQPFRCLKALSDQTQTATCLKWTFAFLYRYKNSYLCMGQCRLLQKTQWYVSSLNVPKSFKMCQSQQLFVYFRSSLITNQT